MAEKKLSEIELISTRSPQKLKNDVERKLTDINSPVFYKTDLGSFLKDAGTKEYVDDFTDTILQKAGTDVLEIKDASGKVLESFKGVDEITKALVKTFEKLEAAIEAEKSGQGTLKHTEDLAERLEAAEGLFSTLAKQAEGRIETIRTAGHRTNLSGITSEIEILQANKVAAADMFQHVYDTVNADPAKVDIDAANVQLLEKVEAVGKEADYAQAFMDVVHDFYQGNAKACKEAAAIVRSNLKEKQAGVDASTIATAAAEPVAKAAGGKDKAAAVGVGQC